MSMTDPIADMLTRIRNAANVRLKTVDMPHSRMKTQVLDALKREGFIGDYQVAGEGTRKRIRVYLKYGRVGESVIQQIRRVSSPGRRVYRPSAKLTPVLRGIGCALISTPNGVLSDRECRKQHVGGEVLCTIW